MEEIAMEKSHEQVSDAGFMSDNFIGKFSVAGRVCVIGCPNDDTSIASRFAQALDHRKHLPIGQFVLDGKCYQIFTERIDGSNQNPESDQFIADILTKRELQIALLVANGRVNKQIACQLHLSEWTVSTHLRRIYSKLKVRSRTQMVVSIMRGTFC